MRLIADIGNTKYKMFLFDGNHIVESYVNSNAQACISYLNKEIILKKTIEKCLISNVRSDADNVYCELLKVFQPIVLNTSLKLPVKLKYESPETLGNDRLAAVCGAVSLHPGKDILVIDAGTAITYDIVERGKVYIGGNISPGLSIRFKALNTFTSKLPLLIIDNEKKGFVGKNTNEAIILGIQNGVMAEFNEYISKMKAKYLNPVIIITGGDLFFFDNSLKKGIFAEPNIIALGLNKILELNE